MSESPAKQPNNNARIPCNAARIPYDVECLAIGIYCTLKKKDVEFS